MNRAAFWSMILTLIGVWFATGFAVGLGVDHVVILRESGAECSAPGR